MSTLEKPHEVFGMTATIERGRKRIQAYRFPHDRPGNQEVHYSADEPRNLRLEVGELGVILGATLGESALSGDRYQTLSLWFSWPTLENLTKLFYQEVQKMAQREAS
jgi:hypothetical protein